MNPMRLLIAIGVLAVLGGLVYYTEKNPPSTGDESIKIVDLEKDDIQAITISRPGKEPITIQKGEGDQWKFGEPLTFPVDDSAVGTLVSNLTPMNSDRVVEENVTDWSPYGLDGEETLQVEVKAKEGQSYRVIFGSDTPTGSGVFARLDGDPRLFTVYSYVKTGFEKEVFDLRDKKLLAVDQDKVSRVAVRVENREIEFGKSGADSWQILKPKPLRADNFTVGDLVRSARNAEMVSVLDEAESSKKYSFARPFAEIEVTDEKGVHTLTVAKDKKDGEDFYYAKSSDLASGVYEVSSTFAESLDKPLEEFRNKKLFDFGFGDLAKLELRAGDTRLTVAKKEDKWVLASEGGRELNSEKVQAVIDDLRGLTASAFTSDDAADQKKYGLGEPAIEAEVTPAAAGGPEKVLITSPERDRVYAAREGLPTTYELEKSAVEELQKNIQDLLKQEDESSQNEEGEAPSGS